MLGHEDECNQAEAFGLTGGLETIREDASPVVVPQERSPTMAGERQLVQMAVPLEVTHSLSMRSSIHVSSVTLGTGKASGTPRCDRGLVGWRQDAVWAVFVM